MKHRFAQWALSCSAFLAVVSACESAIEVGADRATGFSAGGNLSDAGPGLDAGSGGEAGRPRDPGECIETKCGKKLYLCGDCKDDDGDGLIDAADPECVGPCDNTEDSFHSSIPGQGGDEPNDDACNQDCYFDANHGFGDDGCTWSHKCDPRSVAPDYPPAGEQCAYESAPMLPGGKRTCDELLTQPSSCLDVCVPLTPNGCDCFGCCELPSGSGSFVWIGATVGGVGRCDSQNLDDPTKCKPCTPVPSCFNDCKRCEICIGKPTRPSDCDGSPPGQGQCPPGLAECGGEQSVTCEAGRYCVSGCCVPAPE